MSHKITLNNTSSRFNWAYTHSTAQHSTDQRTTMDYKKHVSANWFCLLIFFHSLQKWQLTLVINFYLHTLFYGRILFQMSKVWNALRLHRHTHIERLAIESVCIFDITQMKCEPFFFRHFNFKSLHTFIMHKSPIEFLSVQHFTFAQKKNSFITRFSGGNLYRI